MLTNIGVELGGDNVIDESSVFEILDAEILQLKDQENQGLDVESYRLVSGKLLALHAAKKIVGIMCCH